MATEESNIIDYALSRFRDADVQKRGYLEFSEVKELFREVIVGLLTTDENFTEQIDYVTDEYINQFRVDKLRLNVSEFVNCMTAMKRKEDAIEGERRQAAYAHDY